ncbi:5'-3' exonuclease [Mycoplasma sp. HF14]
MNNKPNLHLLIDGNYLMFQSFYASSYGNHQNIMRTSKGVPTNGINLFMHQLIKLLDFYKPTHIFIAFDSQHKSFRHDMYDSYKAGRLKAPDDLYIQFDIIKELLSKLNIAWQEMAGFEADDLVAAYCYKIAPEEDKIIFSRDKDLHQLINQHVSVIERDPHGYSLLTEKNYYFNYGFHPNQVVDYKALAGDTSDNLKGVEGVGNKTAINLLEKFQTVQNLYNSRDQWKSCLTKSLINKLTEGERDAMFCLKMAKLNPNIDEFKTDSDLYLFNPTLENAMDQLKELELKEVIGKITSRW